MDFAGKRVGVVGTGSSGVQAIPVIAEQAGHVTVFQRTPQYMIPARHGTVTREFLEEAKRNYNEIFEKRRWTQSGFPFDPSERSALEVDDEERRAIYEAAWEQGGFRFLSATFSDIALDRRANDTAAEFIRSKIRDTVRDPETAEKLVPRDHPFASKRTLIDTNYYETYNRENVTLVDIRHDPIKEITASGIRTRDGDYGLDIIVFATGYDAMTGPFTRIDHPRSRRSRPEGEVGGGAEDVPGAGLGGVPQHVHDHGPGEPLGAEQHGPSRSSSTSSGSRTWSRTCSRPVIEVAEAAAEAEAEWVDHVNDVASKTLYLLADSWYLGANIPGKPRVFMPYAGGVGQLPQALRRGRRGRLRGVRPPRVGSPSPSAEPPVGSPRSA